MNIKTSEQIRDELINFMSLNEYNQIKSVKWVKVGSLNKKQKEYLGIKDE